MKIVELSHPPPTPRYLPRKPQTEYASAMNTAVSAFAGVSRFPMPNPPWVRPHLFGLTLAPFPEIVSLVGKFYLCD